MAKKRSTMIFGKAQSNCLSIKKPNTSPMSTRNVVKKHLKEWNKDESDEVMSDRELNITMKDIKADEDKILGMEQRMMEYKKKKYG